MAANLVRPVKQQSAPFTLLGTFWTNPQGDFFVLANTHDRVYAAISLATGQRWRDPDSQITEATMGLSRVTEPFVVKPDTRELPAVLRLRRTPPPMPHPASFKVPTELKGGDLL